MRISRTAAVAGVALMIGGLGATAYAAGTTTVANQATPTSNITVTWSGQVRPAGSSNLLFITECWKDGDAPGFNPAVDCSLQTQINPTFSAAGSATFGVFNGDEPGFGEWGCGPLTTAGLPTSAQCFVRLAPGSVNNVLGDEFLPLTFGAVAPPVDVPEVPLNILLPASAAAIFGAVLLINRKRQSANV